MWATLRVDSILLIRWYDFTFMQQQVLLLRIGNREDKSKRVAALGKCLVRRHLIGNLQVERLAHGGEAFLELPPRRSVTISAARLVNISSFPCY